MQINRVISTDQPLVVFLLLLTCMSKSNVCRGNVRFFTRVYHVMIIQKSFLERLILGWNAILGRN